MGQGEEEWSVVRRRRGTSSTQAFQELVNSKRLSIPVVACAFSSLREDDPDEIRKREKRKEKRQRNRQNKKTRQDDDHDDDEEEQEQQQASSTPARSKPTTTSSSVAVSSTPKSKTVPVVSASSGNWLYQLFYAVLLWLKTLLGLTKSKKAKKRKAPPVQPQPANIKPPAPVPAAAERAAGTTPAKAAPAANTPAPAQINSTAKTTPATAPTPPPPATPVAGPAAQVATASPKAASAPTTATQPANHRPPPATKPTPPPPTGPATKCDRDWVRGRFVVSSLSDAHADVVSSVAMSGTLGLTAGYDGSLKVWSIKGNGRLTRVKNLTGHTGRVEAVAAHADSQRAASTGRDSSLKVWSLGEPHDKGSTAQELSSVYVYESVKSMVVNWGAQGGAVAALGARSGKTSLFSLDTGKRLGVVKGQGSEVSSLTWGGHSSHQHLLLCGSAGGEVNVWDVRAPAALAQQPVFSLQGSRGKICSLDLSDTTLYVGDYSTTLKAYDLRMLQQDAGVGFAPTKLANAPVFAGDACPVAGLSYCPAAKVLVSSSIAWWTDNWQALEESGPEADCPAALLNVHAVDGLEHEYMYTVRLGAGIVTSMDWQGGSGMLGTTTGTLFSVRLLRGTTNKITESLDEADHKLSERLDVGCEEHSEDEDSEDDDDDN